MSGKPVDSMKNILNHEVPASSTKSIHVNVALLTAEEKKTLLNSPARETTGGLVRVKPSKRHQDMVTATKALQETNPSPVTRNKGRSFGGGVSSIVF